jgi:hypothetical protein
MDLLDVVAILFEDIPQEQQLGLQAVFITSSGSVSVVSTTSLLNG